MKRNLIYKSIGTAALLLLSLASMASAKVELLPDGDGYYVNLPDYGKETLTISTEDIAAGKTTFKLYDDGGKTSASAEDVYGYLLISVPEGYVLQLTGSVSLDIFSYTSLDICDGGEIIEGPYVHKDCKDEFLSLFGVSKHNRVWENIGTITSSGRYIGFIWNSFLGKDNVDLSITVKSVNEVNEDKYSITYVDAEGGSISSVKNSAVEGNIISLEAEPSSGYMLTGVEIKDANNNVVNVTSGGSWYSGNKAMFLMPASNVTVTPKFTNNLTAEGENALYVNLPKEEYDEDEPLHIYIPVGVKSFKVYDDGGVDGKYSNGERSVSFVAPADHKLEVTGRMNVAACDDVLLIINDYEGEIYGSTDNIGPYSSQSGIYEFLSLDFYADVYCADDDFGLDLTVTVSAPPISIVSVTGGVVTADNVSATAGETVTLTPAPNEGYLFVSVNVTDADGNPVAVTGGAWYNASNTATFTMPSGKVTVTPVWSTVEEGYFINMIAEGTKEVTIPDGVTSFKVYDDGGKDGEYTPNSSGALVLTAPEGYAFRVKDEGSSVSGKVQVFDGQNTSSGKRYDIQGSLMSSNKLDVTSSNRYITINLIAKEARAGLDLTVTLFKLPTELTLEDDGEGSYFVNMLANSCATLTIPENVTTFHVYDEGGYSTQPKQGWYLDGTRGCLEMNAPEGTMLKITGQVVTPAPHYLSVYNGDGSVIKEKIGYDKGYSVNVGVLMSTSNVVRFDFVKEVVGDKSSGLELTVEVVKSAIVSVVNISSVKTAAFINGNYVGNDVLDITDAIEVDSVVFQREFTPLTPSSIMLPVALPPGTKVNAEFYALSDVVQVGDSWKATMKNIKMITNNEDALPQPNTPYVVKLDEDESELKFNMNGATAVVQTGDIQKQKNAAGTWFFTGTYAFKDWGKDENSDDLGLVYAFSGSNDGGVAKGTFGRVSTKSKANPMRSYLSKRDKYVTLQGAQGVRGANGKTFASTYSINLMPETIVVEFVDSDENGKERTTAIGRMNPATGEIRLIRMDRTYDLKGRSVNRAKKNARGAYYGKKVR